MTPSSPDRLPRFNAGDMLKTVCGGDRACRSPAFCSARKRLYSVLSAPTILHE